MTYWNYNVIATSIYCQEDNLNIPLSHLFSMSYSPLIITPLCSRVFWPISNRRANLFGLHSLSLRGFFVFDNSFPKKCDFPEVARSLTFYKALMSNIFAKLIFHAWKRLGILWVLKPSLTKSKITKQTISLWCISPGSRVLQTMQKNSR